MSSSMPIPPPYAEKTTESVETCRDYVRTGRCKYGATCKYYHPPNVQQGGGMKAPLNSKEPLYPVRPNEPICQYYMKHGTCKFGQACKFHHPPQNAMCSVVPGEGNVMVNMGGRKIDAPQLVLNPVGTDPTGSSVMMQLLPQRPGEPDCIYFLKNGRCKYGAICRYHHPINYHNRRVEEQRRPRSQHEAYSPTHTQVQYVSAPAGFASVSQVVVSDGPVAFVNVDTGTHQVYKPVSLEGPLPYVGSSTVATEQGSTTSSIASSYDTTNSSIDHLAAQGDASAALWSRARKNGSGGSLNAYNVERGTPHSRGTIPTVLSDGQIDRRGRASSAGSASDHGHSYYDNASSTVARSNVSRDVGPSFRNDRSYSFDQTRRIPANQVLYASGESDAHHRAAARPPMRGGHRRRSRQGPRHRNDEGFTMMTSALLNMLDTPEETPSDVYSDDGSYLYQVNDTADPSGMFESLSLQEGQAPIQYPGEPREADSSQWSPSWQGSNPPRAEMDPQPQAMPAMYPGNHHASPNSEHSSDFGLYLP